MDLGAIIVFKCVTGDFRTILVLVSDYPTFCFGIIIMSYSHQPAESQQSCVANVKCLATCKSLDKMHAEVATLSSPTSML